MNLIGFDNLCNFRHLKLWAERGLIHIEDTRDGAYESVSVRTMLRRVAGISDMLARSRETMKRSGFMYSDTYEEHQRMLEQMTDVLQQARNQGMPSDPVASRDLVRRRPCSVSIPGAASML